MSKKKSKGKDEFKDIKKNNPSFSKKRKEKEQPPNLYFLALSWRQNTT